MTKFNLIRITTVPLSLSGLLRGQHRYMTQQGFEVVGVSSAGKGLDDVNKSEGIRTEAVEMTRTLSPVKDLKSLWQLYRLCRKEKSTIVQYPQTSPHHYRPHLIQGAAERTDESI